MQVFCSPTVNTLTDEFSNSVPSDVTANHGRYSSKNRPATEVAMAAFENLKLET
jgi:hypothetical protein